MDPKQYSKEIIVLRGFMQSEVHLEYQLIKISSITKSIKIFNKYNKTLIKQIWRKKRVTWSISIKFSRTNSKGNMVRKRHQNRMRRWSRLTRIISRQQMDFLTTSKIREKVLTASNRDIWISMTCQNINLRWRRNTYHMWKMIVRISRWTTQYKRQKLMSNLMLRSSLNYQVPNRIFPIRALSDKISQNKWKGRRMS